MPGSLAAALLLTLLGGELLGPNNAIFFGGDGDGFDSATAVVTVTNPIFGGGNGDGYDSGSFASGDFLFDWGDAPDPTYPTLETHYGARHVIGGDLWLGAGVDPEGNGQPTSSADGDDLNGADDEDGVEFLSPLVLGDPVSVLATASAPGQFDGWIDFNQDGDWDDAGEQIFSGEPLAAGPNSISFPVPITATPGSTYARFRVSSTGGLTPGGPAFDGEVEDYQASIVVAVPPIADAGADRTVADGNEVNVNTEAVLLGGSPAASSGTPPYAYQWTIQPPAGFDLDSDNDPNPVFTGTTVATFTAELEVTDDNGMSDTDSAQIEVVCPFKLDVFNTILTGDVLLEATSTVTMEQTVIASGANVTVLAGQATILLEGLHIENGAVITYALDPSADCMP